MGRKKATSAEYEERFWSRVVKAGPDECWLWTGAVTENGHGTFKVDSRTDYAHRFSYRLHVGPIPDRMEVDHVCHVRNCVNPKHLRLATRKQNMENRIGARSGTKSGIRGVTWDAAKGFWMARVYHYGKPYFLGYYTDPEVAGIVAQKKRNELFTHNVEEGA